MKKIYSFIFAVAASFITLTSCVGSLDPEPYGLVDLDLIWTKYNYTKSYVDRISIAHSNVLYGETAAYTDEAQHVEDRTSGNYYKWISSDFNAANFMLGGGYDSYYNNIRTCTYYITNEHRISYEGLSDEERTYWLVRARLCRAWDYFELMRHYGQAVIYTEVYSTDETFRDVKRNTVEEIADFIISELDWCLQQPENEKSPYAFRWKLSNSDAGVLNRGFAWVLKARTALYAASPLFYEEGSKYTWEYAYQINKDAVDALLAHDHKLFDVKPTDSYAFNSYDYYHVYPVGDISRSVDKETIFACSSTLNMWQDNGLPITKGQKSCGFCPTQELVDSYETIDGEPILDLENPYADKEHLVPNYNKKNKLYDPQNPYANRDPRFYGSIYYNGAPRFIAKPDSVTVYTYEGGNCGISEAPTETFNTRTGYYLRKYNQNTSDEDGNHDGHMNEARMAEMYLNLAECACEAGHISDALDAVNMVRERAGMPIIEEGIEQNYLRLRIRNERRVELAYENFRFWDVRRWKIINQTEEHVTGMKITKESNGKYTYTRFPFAERIGKGQDKYLLYPLYEDEVNKMLELTGVDWQNPGW